MRRVTLAKTIAHAERLRLALMAKRQARRGAWAAAAALFLLLLAVTLHLAIFVSLSPRIGGAYAALILLGIDFILMAAFGLLSLRNKPSAEEREAAWIGRRARAATGDQVRSLTPFAPAPGHRRKRTPSLRWLLPR